MQGIIPKKGPSQSVFLDSVLNPPVKKYGGKGRGLRKFFRVQPMRIAARTFRVFVSSTFEDLKEERDALQRKVFTKLRTLCEQHGAVSGHRPALGRAR